MSWHLRLRRLRHLKRVVGTPLAAVWRSGLCSAATPWEEVQFLVCDAEMSSLDPATGEVLSLGWVCVENGIIELSSAEHHLLRPERNVGDSATIHQLRDCELEDAAQAAEVMPVLLAAALGKVMVFHNSQLDIAFLDRISQQCYGAPLLMMTVDTLQLEHRLMSRRDQPVAPGELRLQACRDRYGLPALPAHNALTDALATAELLVAHATQRAIGGSLRIGALL